MGGLGRAQRVSQKGSNWSQKWSQMGPNMEPKLSLSEIQNRRNVGFLVFSLKIAPRRGVQKRSQNEPKWGQIGSRFGPNIYRKSIGIVVLKRQGLTWGVRKFPESFLESSLVSWPEIGGRRFPRNFSSPARGPAGGFNKRYS